MTEAAPEVPFDGLTLVKKFASRKNSVYLVERENRPLVMKIFSSDRYKNEYCVLQAAYSAGVPVPRPVDQKGKAILMEYVDGPTVNDLIDREQRTDLVLDVASWLARFHRAFATGEDEVLVKSDAIFKNFIVADRVYGIDFELARWGRPEEDVGETISFLLDTAPMFTEDKYRLAYSFIKRYEAESGIILDNIEDSIAKSLIEAASFRPGQRELIYRKAKDLIVLKPFSR
ncbi:MAG: putative bifunctional tRNA threonylcarbamoyladenosine biosynthesis protein [Methanocella sp. PtaU1.Bin125]|nr:MAG: putative bifunctional tRNA threonylcarbamoyladenosine biosynthesis protein [Methanocella sp. PtaU1.Bin125]